MCMSILNETNRHCQFKIILNTQFSFRIRQHADTRTHRTSTILQMFRDHFLAFHHFLFFYGLSFCTHIKNESEKEGKNNKANTIKNAIHFTSIAVIRYTSSIILLLCVIDRHEIASTVLFLSWHTRTTKSDIIFVQPKADKYIEGNNDHSYISPLIACAHENYWILSKLKTFYRNIIERKKMPPLECL